MNKVRLEILSWLTETLDIEETGGAVTFEQEIEDGKTVGDLLNRLAVRHQRLGQAIFDVKAQKLTERVSIYFNGRNLELENGLSTKLSHGDTLTLIAPIVGG